MRVSVLVVSARNSFCSRLCAWSTAALASSLASAAALSAVSAVTRTASTVESGSTSTSERERMSAPVVPRA